MFRQAALAMRERERERRERGRERDFTAATNVSAAMASTTKKVASPFLAFTSLLTCTMPDRGHDHGGAKIFVWFSPFPTKFAPHSIMFRNKLRTFYNNNYYDPLVRKKKCWCIARWGCLVEALKGIISSNRAPFKERSLSRSGFEGSESE